MIPTLDTNDAIAELRQAKLTKRQAETITRVILKSNENLANKQDIALLQKDIESLRKDMQANNKALRSEMDSLRTELKGEISNLTAKQDSLRTELKGEISKIEVKQDSLRFEIKADMAAMHRSLYLQMLVTTLGITGLLFAALQYAN